MRSHHVCMERKLKGNKLFGGHRNPEQRSTPRMPLSSGWERPFRRRDFLKKGFTVRLGSERCSGGPVTYIKVALSNVEMCLLYVKGREEGKNGCANDAMSGRVAEMMMRDMRRET